MHIPRRLHRTVGDGGVSRNGGADRVQHTDDRRRDLAVAVTLASFGGDIAKFGEAMGNYYAAISGIDIPKMEGVVTAVWSLVVARVLSPPNHAARPP